MVRQIIGIFLVLLFFPDKYTLVEDVNGIPRDDAIWRIAVPRNIPHNVHCRLPDDIHATSNEISLGIQASIE